MGGDAPDLLAGGDGNDDFFAADDQADTLNGGQGNDNAVAADLELDEFNGVEFGALFEAPEIAVSQNGNGIADGATTPISFGSVTQGDTGPTLTFTVTNTGNDDLSLGNVVLPPGFTLVEGLPGTLNPSESDTFSVQVDTTVAGTLAGEIVIANSDPDENPFNFAVTATVTIPPPQLPEIVVSVNGNNVADGQGTAIDFGSVTQGQGGPTLTFTVRNTGNAVLNLSSITLPDGYTLVEGLAGSLDPDQSDTFTVRLDTATPGTKPGQLSFATNDTDEDPFNFPITAPSIRRRSKSPTSSSPSPAPRRPSPTTPPPSTTAAARSTARSPAARSASSTTAIDRSPSAASRSPRDSRWWTASRARSRRARASRSS